MLQDLLHTGLATIKGELAKIKNNDRETQITSDVICLLDLFENSLTNSNSHFKCINYFEKSGLYIPATEIIVGHRNVRPKSGSGRILK